MHVVGIKQIIQRALVSYAGVTTSDGAGGGTTLVDSNLSIDYDGQTVLISSGSYTGQSRDIDGDTSGGTVTPSSAFGGQIVAGTAFFILSGIPAMAEFDDIKGTGWTNENLTTLDANLDSVLADIGDASAAALGSILGILGNPAQTFLAMIGYEGATSLAVKLTAARAGYLDELVAGGGMHDALIADAAGANIAADIIAAQADIATIITALDGLVSASGIFHEQADVAVDITAVAGSETNVFDLSTASTRYIVRSLRLKCADPGANTVTVRLYELVDDASTVVDTFTIDTIIFGTYHSLMDMFGLPHLAGDSLKVTVQTSAGSYAVTGQYSHGKTNV